MSARTVGRWARGPSTCLPKIAVKIAAAKGKAGISTISVSRLNMAAVRRLLAVERRFDAGRRQMRPDVRRSVGHFGHFQIDVRRAVLFPQPMPMRDVERAAALIQPAPGPARWRPRRRRPSG